MKEEKPKRRKPRGLRNLRRGRTASAETLPDRRVIDPPKGVKIAIGAIIDPFGLAEPPKKIAKLRPDGSSAPGEGEWVSSGQPLIVVARSIRTDPLGWMHSHGHIGEELYLAGRRWQALYERCHVGSVQAVDTSKEPVDGGRSPELMTDGQRNAIRLLNWAEQALLRSASGDKVRGVGRVQLVRDVLATGMFIKVAASARGISAERAVGALAKEFHQSLTVLAAHFGLITVASTKTKIRGWRSDQEDKEVSQKGRQEEAGEKQAA